MQFYLKILIKVMMSFLKLFAFTKQNLNNGKMSKNPKALHVLGCVHQPALSSFSLMSFELYWCLEFYIHNKEIPNNKFFSSTMSSDLGNGKDMIK